MRSKLVFVLLFIVLGIVALQIPVSTLAGSKVKFTLFDLVSPISGAFLGAGLGIVSVLGMQAGNLLFHGFSGVNNDSILKLIATLRFLPLIFGVWFFALKSYSSSESKTSREVSTKNIIFFKVSSRFSRTIIFIVPLLAILVFNLHPIGRTVWFYSLFWIIPFFVWPFSDRFLLARSLGATMTAHSVGGAVWIWAFNLPATVWVSLIPVVILERSIFALGISASYILMNNVLGFLSAKKLLPKTITFDKRYLLKIR